MVKMTPGSSWNSIQRLLLLKERARYAGVRDIAYEPRLGAGQSLPTLAYEPHTYPPEYGAVEPGTTMGAVNRKTGEPVNYQPYPVALPEIEERKTRIADVDDAESAKRRLRGKVIPPGERGAGKSLLVAGEPHGHDMDSDARENLKFRFGGKRKYDDDEPLHEVDTRHAFSPLRALQEYRERKPFGEKKVEGEKRPLAVADLPDEPGRERRRKLVDAFRNQQKLLERLVREGKPLPRTFGELAGKDPRDLLSRMGGKGVLYDMHGKEIPIGRKPVLGTGGLLEQAGGEGLQRWKDRPLREWQASPMLNPANWFSGTQTSVRRARNMKRRELDDTLGLLHEVGRRRIYNPNYVPDKAVDERIGKYIQGLLSDDSPSSRNLANTLLRNPYARDLAMRIKSKQLEEDRQMKTERSLIAEEARRSNPLLYRYREIMDAIHEHNIPLSTDGKQKEVVARWRNYHRWLNEGYSPEYIQEMRPSMFSRPLTAEEKESDDPMGDEGEEDDWDEDFDEELDEGEDEDEEPPKKDKGKGVKVVGGIDNHESYGFKSDKPAKSEMHKYLDEQGLKYGPRDTNAKLMDLINSHHAKNASVSGGEAAAPATEEGPDYPQMTVPNLKDIARGYGLPVGGNKADLVDRIREHEAASNAPEPEPQAEEEAVRDQAQAEAEMAENKATAHSKNKAIMQAAHASLTSSKDVDSGEANEFMQHLMDSGITMGEKGNYKLEDGRTVPKAVAQALANAPQKHLSSDAFTGKSPSQMLQIVLAERKIWGKMPQKMQKDIEGGKNLEQFEHMFHWLTGQSLQDIKRGGSEDVDEAGTFTLSVAEEHPIDLAWAVLKGV